MADATYVTDFLLTFRVFMTPRQLMQHMTNRCDGWQVTQLGKCARINTVFVSSCVMRASVRFKAVALVTTLNPDQTRIRNKYGAVRIERRQVLTHAVLTRARPSRRSTCLAPRQDRGDHAPVDPAPPHRL